MFSSTKVNSGYPAPSLLSLMFMSPAFPWNRKNSAFHKMLLMYASSDIFSFTLTYASKMYVLLLRGKKIQTSRKFVQIRKTYNKIFHKYWRFLSQRSNLYLYSRALSFRALTFLLSKAHSELKTWALFAGEEQCLFWGVMQTVRYRHKFAVYTIIYNRCLCVWVRDAPEGRSCSLFQA